MVLGDRANDALSLRLFFPEPLPNPNDPARMLVLQLPLHNHWSAKLFSKTRSD